MKFQTLQRNSYNLESGYDEKSKITKIPMMEIQIGKFLIKWQNQTLKHIKRMINNCYIPGLVQAFPYVESGGLNLVYS